jgi:hypothetical protein
MVGLAEVVLYVVVLGWYAQLDKLLLERPRLLEETMNLSVNRHIALTLVLKNWRTMLARLKDFRGPHACPHRPPFT